MLAGNSHTQDFDTDPLSQNRLATMLLNGIPERGVKGSGFGGTLQDDSAADGIKNRFGIIGSVFRLRISQRF